MKRHTTEYPADQINDDIYARKVAEAIERVDAADDSYYYVAAYVVAESSEPSSVWLWDGSEYVQATRRELLASWYPAEEGGA